MHLDPNSPGLIRIIDTIVACVPIWSLSVSLDRYYQPHYNCRRHRLYHPHLRWIGIVDQIAIVAGITPGITITVCLLRLGTGHSCLGHR